MSIVSTPNGLNCIHSSHLFSNLLCENQSLLKKIANVAFHVLTLGIPLAIYHIISCCRPKTSSTQSSGSLQTVGINSVQQNKSIKPYSNLGQEAIEFARKKLQEYPGLTPAKFSGGWYGSDKTNQPINPEIALLTTLYWNVAFKNFENVMKENKENPWSNQEVIQAADECMKIAYAISNLTLDDLKSFTEALSSKGDKRTYAKALTEQDSYQYRTFYYCTNAYHWLRGEIAWSKNLRNEWLLQSKFISNAHASAFYQKGTIQNSWNDLYNNYCDRVRLYVNEKELQSADNRHVTWTKKDTGMNSFKSVPDTQPT